MRRALTLTVALLSATLAGCLGGDDEPEPLGTYSLTSAEAGGGGEHAGHGGGGALAGTIELFHFNGTQEETFEHHEGAVGLVLSWSLSTGAAQVRLIDASGKAVYDEALSGDGQEGESLEAEHGTFKLNVTGTDATGTIEVATGKPAALGLSQSEPITYEGAPILETASEDHTWDSATGMATVTINAEAVAGSLTIKALDGMAVPLDPIVVEGPAQVEQTFELAGAMGTWTITIQRELFTGPVSVVIAPADVPSDDGAH